MDEQGKLVDLLLFYTLERILFNRMVGPIGKNPQLVKMVMTFWLLLEEMGYHDLTRRINSFDNSTIDTIFFETIACLNCIRPGANEPDRENDIPALSTILDGSISRRFFYYNNEFMLSRFMHIMDTVCNRIFGQNAAVEVDESVCVIRTAVRPGGQGSSIARNRTDRVMVAGSRVAREPYLNPNASEFFPRQTNVDARTMFLTFSKGYPLTRQEIINFFTLKWGNVVEDVVIEEARGGDPPLHGRVIFIRHSIIGIILNGQSKAKFIVGRKHLWARVYVPRRR